MSAVQIRDVLPDEGAKLLELRLQLFSESDFLLYGPGEYSITPTEISAQIEKASKFPNSRALIAETEGSFVGFLSATGSPVPRIRHSAHLALGVARSWWGRGVGTSLMKEALRWAPTAGVSRFELFVMATNPRAISFYERLGFKFEGLRRRAYIINGEPIDDHLMGYVFEA